MLQHYEKFRMEDLNKNGEFFVEVNWNPQDQRSNDCKLIKFTFGDKEVTVRREHLLSMIFAFGTEDQQQKLIPQKISEQRVWETVLGIKANKDIKKGELINVPVKLNLPSIEKEVIMGIQEAYKKHAVR